MEVENGFSRRQFASDTCAGVCPEAWEAYSEANRGHAPAYGDDAWTKRAQVLIRDMFETDCEVFFVSGGTVANALALAALCRSYHSVVCANVAHAEVDECGAPEFFSGGAKIVTVPGQNGKLTPESIAGVAEARTDVHYPKLRAISVTQATEVGTVYSDAEMSEIGTTARRYGLAVHMDGARFANAQVSSGCSAATMTWKAGVDVLSLGGIKNGLPAGDTVVFFKRELAAEFEYRRKQAGQLASKMRFLAAPWIGLLSSGAWIRNATRANQMAAALANGLNGMAGVDVIFPCEANSVFVKFPPGVEANLKGRGWDFYSHPGWGGARLMCAWDTDETDVNDFLKDVRELIR